MDTRPTRGVLPPEVTILTSHRVPKIRTITKVVIEGLTNEVFVHNNTLVNLVRGLAERVFLVERNGTLVPPPQPAPGVFGRLREFQQALRDRCGSSTRISYENFVGMYTGRKATIYGAAVESLMARPVMLKDSYLSTFVKAEKVVPTTSKPDPAPRVIQPRHPRYNVEVGRFLKTLEHKIYDGIKDLWGEPTVMKGYTVEGVAKHLKSKWDSYRKPVAIGLDASRFDQHISADALRWEHQTYLTFFHGKDRRDLAKLLGWQLRNRGFARASDGEVRYTVDGCRMSGDMNTALGNCLIMCALVWLRLRELNIRGSLANNGDDCVVIIEESDLNAFSDGLREWFLEFGFTMKVEDPVRTFEQIEFCRMHPVWAGDAWVMVRNPLDALSRDLTTVLSLTSLSAVRKWWYTVGLGGSAITHGVPVFSRLYKAMLDAGVPSEMALDPWLSESGFMRLKSKRPPQPITPEARYSFWLAFGITPSAQEEFERNLRLECSWAPGVSSLAGLTWNKLFRDG